MPHPLKTGVKIKKKTSCHDGLPKRYNWIENLKKNAQSPLVVPTD
jgi:hypothetical protein